MGINDESRSRAELYAEQYGLLLGKVLGFGIHGIVFATNDLPQDGPSAKQSALKAHQREVEYCRERDVYLRLRDKKVTKVRGCHVPQLLRFDDEYLVIEMTIVKRPFVLDFAGAYLDKAPDFSEEVMADWRTEKEEQFGKHWPEVQQILAVLETYGIFMEDVHPNNVSLAD